MSKVRKNDKIKTDIIAAGEISRQDIYEILQNSSGKTHKEKASDVETFLDSLPQEIKDKKNQGGQEAKEAILADLCSYPI